MGGFAHTQRWRPPCGGRRRSGWGGGGEEGEEEGERKEGDVSLTYLVQLSGVQ